MVGADLQRPTQPADFPVVGLDLGAKGAAGALQDLIHLHGVTRIVHLAFVLDPVRTGITERHRVREANVGGMRRLLRAIEHVNRGGLRVRTLIYPSSISAYGPDLAEPVTEDAPLKAHTLAYARHKKETDLMAQRYHHRLGGCGVCLLRLPIYAGRTMDNYILRALRGIPSGSGLLARWLLRLGLRVPLLAPRDQRHLRHRFQFIHVDDAARLMAYFLETLEPGALEILNVSGRGQPLELAEMLEISRSRVVRLPGYRSVGFMMKLMAALGVSGIPPDALPYFFGTYLMDTSRLQARLGSDYERVIRHTCREAFAESFE